MIKLQQIFLSLFILVLFNLSQVIAATNNNDQNENQLIYEAIKKYEEDSYEKNKLTICTHAISQFMNSKSDKIRLKLENQDGELREQILSKLYFSTIEQCLIKLRKEEPDSYISINFIDDVKWEDYLNIDLQNLNKYKQDLTESQVIIQKSIEKIIEFIYIITNRLQKAPILERDTIINIFGYKLKYNNLPYLGVIFAFSMIGYAIFISFKEFMFNSDNKIRLNAHGISKDKKRN